MTIIFIDREKKMVIADKQTTIGNIANTTSKIKTFTDDSNVLQGEVIATSTGATGYQDLIFNWLVKNLDGKSEPWPLPNKRLAEQTEFYFLLQNGFLYMITDAAVNPHRGSLFFRW